MSWVGLIQNSFTINFQVLSLQQQHLILKKKVHQFQFMSSWSWLDRITLMNEWRSFIFNLDFDDFYSFELDWIWLK